MSDLKERELLQEVIRAMADGMSPQVNNHHNWDGWPGTFSLSRAAFDCALPALKKYFDETEDSLVIAQGDRQIEILYKDIPRLVEEWGNALIQAKSKASETRKIVRDLNKSVEYYSLNSRYHMERCTAATKTNAALWDEKEALLKVVASLQQQLSDKNVIIDILRLEKQ